MMMMKKILLLLSIFSSPLVFAWAWGPTTYEPLMKSTSGFGFGGSGGNGFRTSTRRTILLKASSASSDYEEEGNGDQNEHHDGNDDEIVQSYRSTLERLFNLEYNEEEEDGYSIDSHELGRQTTTPSSSGPVLFPMLDHGADDHPEFDRDDFLCNVDDENCNEEQDCPIPEDFKSLPGGESNIDVMAFLGIRRVEPLKVKTNNDRTSSSSEWE